MSTGHIVLISVLVMFWTDLILKYVHVKAQIDMWPEFGFPDIYMYLILMLGKYIEHSSALHSLDSHIV